MQQIVLACDICDRWVHARCEGLSTASSQSFCAAAEDPKMRNQMFFACEECKGRTDLKGMVRTLRAYGKRLEEFEQRIEAKIDEQVSTLDKRIAAADAKAEMCRTLTMPVEESGTHTYRDTASVDGEGKWTPARGSIQRRPSAEPKLVRDALQQELEKKEKSCNVIVRNLPEHCDAWDVVGGWAEQLRLAGAIVEIVRLGKSPERVSQGANGGQPTNEKRRLVRVIFRTLNARNSFLRSFPARFGKLQNGERVFCRPDLTRTELEKGELLRKQYWALAEEERKKVRINYRANRIDPWQTEQGTGDATTAGGAPVTGEAPAAGIAPVSGETLTAK